MENQKSYSVGDVCYLTNDLKKQCPMTVTEIEKYTGDVHVVWRDKTNKHLYFAYPPGVLCT